MRCRAIVDLAALRSNFRRLSRRAGAGAALLCVVKADAYGHGAAPVSEALQSAGARHFAVATLEEAAVLREAGLGGSVLVLGGLESGTERHAAGLCVEPAVSTVGQLERWNEAAAKVGRRLPCHLLLNTGMNRLGLDFDPRDDPSGCARLLDALTACDRLDVRGVATHYADAERLGNGRTDRQNARFSRQLACLRAAGVAPRFVHAANSAAIVHRGVGGLGDGFRHSMVRPGLALYGYVAAAIGGSAGADLGLRPVLEWRARIVRTRNVPAGEGLGYGPSFVTPRPMRVGLLSVGYADGYSWRLSNCGTVCVRGVPCRVLGQVSMDLTLIDLSGCDEARVGDEAALLGSEPYGPQEMAGLIRGSAYEVLCCIGARVPRQYVERPSG